MRLMTKNCFILFVFIMCAGFVSARNEIITLKQGDPLILLQKKKTAIFEIDYSQMIVTDGKDHDNDMPFYEWMQVQDEDNDKWTEDWIKKDSIACNKSFRDKFNDEIEGGMKLTKLGKDYKVTLRINMINFGKTINVTKTIFLGFSGGSAKASGELEIRDLNNGEVMLILAFKDLVGEGSVKQIGRLKGIFENLGEKINEYLEDYQEEYEKQQKKEEKLRKKELKKAGKNKE